MCTYSITVDESVLQKMHPSFSREAFGRWLQRHVDELVADITSQPHTESPIAHSEEEMRLIVDERLRMMKSGQASYIGGEDGFAQVMARYGL